VIRLSWDAASAGLRETLLPDRTNPLYLASVGTYPSMAEARRARLTNGYCLGAYWVLDAARFPALSGGRRSWAGSTRGVKRPMPQHAR